MDAEDFDVTDSFDRYARLVRGVLGVPTALVTIVEASRQIFPGALGLPEPWQSQRETPLTHSFCQYVVAKDAPLVVEDARLDPELADNLAITDLNVIAYAGVPLRDVDGRAYGSLCAIESAPRRWTDDDVQILTDLAGACSAELIARVQGRRADAAEQRATAATARAMVLLKLSEVLADTASVAEVAAAVQGTASELGAARIGLWMVDQDVPPALHYVEHAGLDWAQARRSGDVPLSADHPLSNTVRDRRRLAVVEDSVARLARWPELTPPQDEPMAEAAAYLALMASGQPIGCLGLAYEKPRSFTDDDRAMLSALGAYTAQAVQRALLLEHSNEAALVLQKAMLTELPSPDHLHIAARYLPAAAGDLVGGDWYDALMQPDDGATVVVIGDVFGHDMQAAAGMGGIRSMLRMLTVDHPDLTPGQLLMRLDRALKALRNTTLATMIVARIEQSGPDHDADRRHLRWTNAGHPPPLLIDLDGTTRFLEAEGADPLIGVRPDHERRDHVVEVTAESTVLLYTDGLVETRAESLDVGLERLARVVARHRDLEPPEMLDAVIADMVGLHPPDDVAVLAVRFHSERSEISRT